MQTLTRRQSEVVPSFGATILGGRSEGQSSALEAQHEPTVRVVAKLGPDPPPQRGWPIVS